MYIIKATGSSSNKMKYKKKDNNEPKRLRNKSVQPEKDVSALAPRICIFIQSLQTDTRTYVCVAVETVGTENRQHVVCILLLKSSWCVFFSSSFLFCMLSLLPLLYALDRYIFAWALFKSDSFIFHRYLFR